MKSFHSTPLATRRLRRQGAVLLAVVSCVAVARLGSSRAHAAEPQNACETPHDLDKYKLLRRLSLDLRQRAPSFEEYQALRNVDTVPDEVIASFVASDDFRVAMRRMHENLLWPNISNVKMSGIDAILGRVVASGAFDLAGREVLYRGVRDVACADSLQTDFDPAYPGEYRPVVATVNGERHEGYRMIAPYWDPGKPIKVCAYDAQETRSVKIGGKTVACNTPEGKRDRGCGCGPNLQYCYNKAAMPALFDGFREQMGRAVDKATSGKVPYTDILLAKDTEENGPVAFFRKNLAPSSDGRLVYNAPLPDEQVNDLAFTDPTWHAATRSEQHAGILTLPAYLLRFQTNRGRANRMRVAFMGQYFVPPSTLEATEGCSSDSQDLTARCTCRYCHSTLEPLAAYFAGFSEAGSASLANPALFPLERNDCVGKADVFCSKFYVTRADAHRPGSLISYQFADVHPEYAEHIQGSPRKFAETIIADGTFARAAVATLYRRLVRGDLHVDAAGSDDTALVARLAATFASSGYNYPALVKAMVSLPEYRRVR